MRAGRVGERLGHVRVGDPLPAVGVVLHLPAIAVARHRVIVQVAQVEILFVGARPVDGGFVFIRRRDLIEPGGDAAVDLPLQALHVRVDPRHRAGKVLRLVRDVHCILLKFAGNNFNRFFTDDFFCAQKMNKRFRRKQFFRKRGTGNKRVHIDPRRIDLVNQRKCSKQIACAKFLRNNVCSQNYFAGVCVPCGNLAVRHSCNGCSYLSFRINVKSIIISIGCLDTKLANRSAHNLSINDFEIVECEAIT